MKNLLAHAARNTAIFLLLIGFASAQPSTAPAPNTAPLTPPRVLIVVAHPDDEVCFAATVYEITHNLGGTVDQLVITNGEGGYRYSLLADSYYGVALTDEAVGRAQLPEIRKRELLDAGRILGITNHFFLDEPDLHYTQDIEEVFNTHWHPGVVLPAVERRLEGGKYDFVFTLFPSPQTHGGHKAATITALNAVQQMPGRKPVVLGCQNERIGAQTQPSWKGFESAKHPFTVLPQVYSTDRNVKFGYRDALSYQVIVSWMIAAHKSQGMFQAGLIRGDHEVFAILESGAADEPARAEALFKTLAEKAPHPNGVSAPAH
jgi:LmbE family N-acetylglucosaminyl deacetylase